MENALVSVVMPVYNIEKYLSEAVESILRQTYPHWELILVDDGSKDKSGKICDAFATRDERIHVIHQENHGARPQRAMPVSLQQRGNIFSLWTGTIFWWMMRWKACFRGLRKRMRTVSFSCRAFLRTKQERQGHLPHIDRRILQRDRQVRRR